MKRAGQDPAERWIGAGASHCGAVPDCEHGLSARTLASQLDVIESVSALHSLPTIAAAMGAASGAFSYLNGGGPLVVLLSVLSACAGQAARSWLARRRVNQYVIAAICAV